LVDPANRDSSHVPYIAVIIPEICSKCSQQLGITTSGFTRGITSDPPLGPIWAALYEINESGIYRWVGGSGERKQGNLSETWRSSCSGMLCHLDVSKERSAFIFRVQ
jgi:hypothetical protein